MMSRRGGGRRGGRRRHADAVWTPAAEPGLYAWYRGDLGVTGDGDDISGWADQSGNDRHLLQADASKSPSTATPAAFASRTVIDFDTNDWMSCTSYAMAMPQTTYLVASKRSLSYGHCYDSGAGNASTLFYSNFSGQVFMYAGADIGTTLLWTTPHVLCGAVQSGASASNLYVDTITTPSVTGTASPATGDVLRIGCDPSQAGSFWNGWVAEVIAYSGVIHTAEQRGRVMTYLGDRYGLTVAP